jgi:murein DD-endopeptidase MepM/ murein hydrolase activator NlpD
MADNMINNIQSLTTGVDKLTASVTKLYTALEKVKGVAGDAVTGAMGALDTMGGSSHLASASRRPGTGADGARFSTYVVPGQSNFLYNSMAKFSQFQQSPAGGAVTAGLSLAAGGYAATPDLSLTLQRSVGYYQAGLKAPGINRNQLERATFSAMGGGLSSVGSDAAVAALLAGRGYTPGSRNYLQAAGEVGGAFKYLGIDNAAAASSIAGMQTGSMGANLYQYGITTYDVKTGKDKTMGQISKDLMNLMTGGRKDITAADVQSSFQKGALGANLNSMGFDAGQIEIIRQSMIDLASGRNPDLKKRGSEQGKDANSNTMLTAAGRLSSSQTSLMTKAEDSMIKGFENAADTVEAFNRALSNVIEPLGYLKGLVGGTGGSNAGKGIAGAAGALWNLLKKPLGIAMMAGGGLLAPEGVGIPVAAAGAALATSGGTSGYGASFKSKGVGGGTSGYGAGYAVTAGYGAQDPKVWAATNGKHTGVDYEMKIGTPVKAWKDGVVSAVDIGADYGTSIVIDHENGYQSLYGHLSEKDVKVGDTVKEGGRIGKSGKSGKANGPHLHFEVRHGKNNPVDPSSAGALNVQYASLRPTASAVTSGATTTTGSPATSTASSGGTGAPMGSKDQQVWATTLLTKLGAPVTDNAVRALTTWMSAEGRGWSTSLNRATYNPLNTTYDMPGAVSFNKAGVKAYNSVDQGVEATLATLTGKNADARGYTSIIEALKSGGNVTDILTAINNSAWRSGKTDNPGYNFPTATGGGTSGYGTSVTAPAIGNGNKTVNINLKIDKASDEEAIRFAKKVKQYLKDDAEISMMGSR